MENIDYLQENNKKITSITSISSISSKIVTNVRVDYEIPKKEEYNHFYKKKYTVPYLKFICKEFKLKKTGNKIELIQRIYNYLREAACILTIQKNAKKYLVSKYVKRLKQQINYKKKCKNDTDFFTLEELSEIPNSHFFAFEENNNIWGFNIISIYNLFIKNNSKDILNPYTREKINNNVYDSIISLIKLSNILGITINLNLKNNPDDIQLSLKKQNENTSLELFQTINEFGHYSHYSWFLSLDKTALIRFVRDLIDIWEYRAELTLYTKCKICFPSGNPFRYNLRVLCNNNFYELQKNVLLIISDFITKGITPEFCSMGVSYILCALTLVSSEAAEAMPWFYSSVI